MRWITSISILFSTFVFTSAGAGVASAQTPMDSPTTLTVQNDRAVPVTVFFEDTTGGLLHEIRIGTVDPMTTETIEVPGWLMDGGDGTLSFFLHAEGQGDLDSVDFIASRGDDLGVVVAPEGEYMQTVRAPTTESGEASVTVVNHRKVPATLFVEETMADLGTPVHIRIGTVPAESSATVPIPSWIVANGQGAESDVRFFVHLAGGTDLAVQETTMRPGENVQILVPDA